jgi:hypothetical protein
MENEKPSKQGEFNECGSCRCWKADYAKSKSRTLNTSISDGKFGLCVGGGFDGSQTQSNETCSMWKPLIDKERILPIFHAKGGDER